MYQLKVKILLFLSKTTTLKPISKTYPHFGKCISKKYFLVSTGLMFKNRPVSNFVGKEQLHWKQVSHFTGKRYFIDNLTTQLCLGGEKKDYQWW